VRVSRISSRGYRANRPRKRQESYAPLGPVASGLFLLRASRVGAVKNVTPLACEERITLSAVLRGY
jgi:hypothetical protein